MSKLDLSPPWIIYSEGRKPIAILPAGRPGEVADVSGMSMRLVRQIVNAANQPIRDARVAMVALTKELLALNAKMGAAKAEEPTP